MADEEFSTPWSRRLQKMVAKMTAEELAEFPDLKRIDEAHTLIFNATRELKLAKPGLSLTEAISACGRRLRGLRLGLATSNDVLGQAPTSLHEALKKAHGMHEGWQRSLRGAPGRHAHYGVAGNVLTQCKRRGGNAGDCSVGTCSEKMAGRDL